jgi:hypothetical protein
MGGVVVKGDPFLLKRENQDSQSFSCYSGGLTANLRLERSVNPHPLPTFLNHALPKLLFPPAPESFVVASGSRFAVHDDDLQTIDSSRLSARR